MAQHATHAEQKKCKDFHNRIDWSASDFIYNFFFVISMLASPPHMACMNIQYYSSNRQPNQIACKFPWYIPSEFPSNPLCAYAQHTMLLILVQLHISTFLAAWKYYIKNCISAYSLHDVCHSIAGSRPLIPLLLCSLFFPFYGFFSFLHVANGDLPSITPQTLLLTIRR